MKNATSWVLVREVACGEANQRDAAGTNCSVQERYRACARTEKRRILDEFIAVSGYHRKHAIRLLRKRADTASVRRRSHAVYGTKVRDALILLWETSDRVCLKRLRPLIPDLVAALERHGKLVLDDELRARLLSISAVTIDRLLSDVRRWWRQCGGS